MYTQVLGQNVIDWASMLLAGTVECFQIYSLLLGGLNGEGITGVSNVRALVVAF